MNTTTQEIFHPATPEDRAAMAALRAMVEPHKGQLSGAAARGPYDEIMNRVVAPEGVSYEEDEIAGIRGWWCRPEGARGGEAICHLHGGWFNFGSAKAFRHLAGHLAKAAGVAAFIPEYRLAPEHPYPAAIEDAQRAYGGLCRAGFKKIAVTGDSAGGNLALLLLLRLRDQTEAVRDPLPVGAVALSPTTDLALTGETWSTRASIDPYFTKTQVAEMVVAYLGKEDPENPAVSPLYGELRNLPPISVHVGNDEVLLDDSRRYAKRALEADIDITLEVWECMVHGFLGGIGKVEAAQRALQAIGAFLKTCYNP
jgi:acetyl esterase/lipase